MNVKPLSALSSAEIRHLAAHAAERGERVEDANPFPQGSVSHDTFAAAFDKCAADLRSLSAV